MDRILKLSIVQGTGDWKAPVALLGPNICFKKVVKMLSINIKPKGKTQFDILHILVNSVLCFFWAAKIYIKLIKKCPCLSSLKTEFWSIQNIFWPLIRKILMWTFYGLSPYHPLPSGHPRGQLISKGLFGFFSSPKKRTVD